MAPAAVIPPDLPDGAGVGRRGHRLEDQALGDTVAPMERRLGVALEIPRALLDSPGLLIDPVFPDGRQLLLWRE